MPVSNPLATYWVVKDHATAISISPQFDSFEEAEEWRNALPEPDKFYSFRLWRD